MSLLLSLFSLRALGAPRIRRNHEPEHCTEMGVFSRGGTELVEMSTGETPQLPPKWHNTTGQEEFPHAKELPRTVTASESTVSHLDSPPLEALFVWEVLNQQSSRTASALTQEALESLCWSGSVLCKLLSSALPGSLDERAINWSDGVWNLTSDEALENFQMCHSCAQAQGCDVQGIGVDRLAACEVSCLTDFCLEVLRLSAVQVLPAAGRQFLVAPSSGVPTSSNGIGGGTGSTAAASLSHMRDARCGLKHGSLRIDVPSSTAGNASHTATTGDPREVSGQSGACMPGTAAARRAVAGLERWAVQLAAEASTDPDQVESPGASSSGPPTPSTEDVGPSGQAAAPGPQLQLPPARDTVTTPQGLAAGIQRCGMDPSERQSSSSRPGEAGDVRPSHVTSAGVGATAPGAAAASAKAREVGQSGAPPVTLPGGADGCRGDADALPCKTLNLPIAVGPAHDSLGIAVWEYLAQSLTGSATDGRDGMASSSTPVAAGELRGSLSDPIPSVTERPSPAPPGDEEGRWAAAAETLSGVLASASPVCGLRLPRLRAEHLQCRHPGLRAVLLTWALLAHCRRREGLQPKAPVAAVMPSSRPVTGAADTARSDDGSSSTSSWSGHRPYSDGGSPDPVTGNDQGADTAGVSPAVAAVAAGTAASKMLPASPAPPLPPLRQSLSVGGSVARRHRSAGDRAPKDVLSEHNMLVQQEHQQREKRRRQQQQLQQHRSAGGEGHLSDDVAMRPAAGMLWSGEDDDAEGEDQEERVLRLWLNSLDPGIHVSSLFEQEVTTGWPLLQALEAIQTGCVPWADAFRPPFKDKLRKILSVQNCNLVIEVCTRQLAMPPLVNIGGLDLALGHRRATLSLVFQMMRHHMGMLLGLAAPQSLPAPPPPPSPKYNIPASPGLHQQQQPLGHSHSFAHTPWHGHDIASPHGAQHGAHAPSPQRGTRAHVEVEKAVLVWANTKLMDAAAAAAAAAAAPPASGSAGTAAPPTSEPAVPGADLGLVAPQLPWTPLASFSDKRLGEGRVLLQLLAAICPRSVNCKYVLPGRNAEERGSNARYLLSCARKLGCVIFLGWQDVVAARPNLLLLLLASFMALDRKRAGAVVAAGGATATAAATGLAASAAAPAGTTIGPAL